jgi:hypothetical protein
LHLLRRGLRLWRGLELRRGLRPALSAALSVAALLPLTLLRPLTLVGLVALNLIGEVGGTAAGCGSAGRAMGPRLRALHLWRRVTGTGTRTAMLALARTATARTVFMLLPRLGEGGCGGQCQDGNGYEQAAHLILRENTARLITGLYRFGFPLGPLCSAHA